MAYNGGNGPPPPSRMGHATATGTTTVQTARLLPRNNIQVPQQSPTVHHRPLLNLSQQQLQRSTTPSSGGNGGGGGGGFITLDQPRPGVARVRNVYIETPLRTTTSHSQQQINNNKSNSIKTSEDLDSRFSSSSSTLSSTATGSSSSTGILAEIHTFNHYSNQNSSHYHRPPLNHLLLQPSSHSDAFHQPSQKKINTHPLPILTQPSSTLKKPLKTKRDTASECCEESHLSGESKEESSHADSIICPECGRCRCGACKRTRPLPSTWICSESYQCSAETTLDYCTCMCCVKAAFYHCCKDYEMDSREVSCADKPCSCSPHHRWMRWGCLCLLSTILPCLLCYIPMKGCIKLCELCHSRLTNQGCKCSPPNTPSTANTSLTSKLNSPLTTSDCEDEHALTPSYRRNDTSTNVTNTMMMPLKSCKQINHLI